MFVLVNPVSSGQDLSKAFREEGAECLHLYDNTLIDAFRFDTSGAPKFLYDEDPEVDRRLESLEVSGVIAASEYGVDLAQKLASRLGAEHHDPAAARARRDKLAMLDRVAAAGLAVPRTAEIRDEAEARKTFAEWGCLPVVVKPRASAGSDGCRTCRTEEEVASAFLDNAGMRNLLGSLNGTLLIQERIEGRLYIVNTVSMGGRHVLTELYEKHVPWVDGSPLLRHVVSRTAPDRDEQELVRYTTYCLDALGVREGAAHSEVMLTADGPRLVEVNSRVMGPCLSADPFFAAFGYSQQHLVAERFLRPSDFTTRFDRPYSPALVLARAFLRPQSSGRLVSLDGLRTVRRLAGFHSFSKMPGRGDRVDRHALTTGTGGIAYFVAEDGDLLRHSLEIVHALEDAGELFTVEEAYAE
jgi:predicted ATP-grasp superfamily ATP-dependent carboligase